MSTVPEQRVAVVIEDDDDIRHLLETVLSQAGFRVVATANGASGIEAVRENDPVVTTLDVNMPGMDGFEVARRIRGFSSTYIVMLTALNEEIDTLQGLEAGADDYINKPFRPRELRARIEAMLRRPRTTARLGTTEEPAVAEVTTAPAPVVSQPQQPGYPQQPGFPSAPYQEPASPVSPYPTQPQSVPIQPQPTPQPLYPAPQAAPAYPTQQPAYPAAPQQQPAYPSAPQQPGSATPVAPPAWEQPGAQLPQQTAMPAPNGGTVPGRGSGWMEHNGLWLNFETRVVQNGSQELDLTRSEFDLLAALMESGRRVRTKADLVLLLRGESYVTSHFISEADKRAIEVHMGNLRKKIGDTTGTPKWIETVRGVGYRLTAASE